MNGILVDISQLIIKAYKQGSTLFRFVIGFALFLSAVGLSFGIYGDLNKEHKPIAAPIGIALVVVGFGILFITSIYQQTIEKSTQEKKIEEVEQRAKENPKEPTAAWELARIKLESYLDRNLSQVRSIFWLTVLIMLAGFSLISFGVYTVIESPEKINAALISSISGVIINFIGATFLVLYKSTMSQAQNYVSILERINAVGMSVQILDSLETGEDDLKQKTTAELSKLLLSLYKKA